MRDDGVAQRINDSVGRRVSLTYEQHIGVPTTCFGETQYFVADVRTVSESDLEVRPPAGEGARGALSPRSLGLSLLGSLCNLFRFTSVRRHVTVSCEVLWASG